MKLNRERQINVIRELNTNLEEMAEDDSLFVESAPQLLGDGFNKKAKERDDELKCLTQENQYEAAVLIFSWRPRLQQFKRLPLKSGRPELSKESRSQEKVVQ